MLFPVRCYTCGTVLAHKYDAYVARVTDENSRHAALEHVAVSRLCCRRMFLGHVDIVGEHLTHAQVDVVLDPSGTVLKRKPRASRSVEYD